MVNSQHKMKGLEESMESISLYMLGSNLHTVLREELKGYDWQEVLGKSWLLEGILLDEYSICERPYRLHDILL